MQLKTKPIKEKENQGFQEISHAASAPVKLLFHGNAGGAVLPFVKTV